MAHARALPVPVLFHHSDIVTATVTSWRTEWWTGCRCHARDVHRFLAQRQVCHRRALRCFFYSTQGRLKYVTAIECHNNSYMSPAKRTHKREAKNEHGSPSLLINISDSRLRLYSLGNFAIKCKVQGPRGHAEPDPRALQPQRTVHYLRHLRVAREQARETRALAFFMCRASKKSKNRQEHSEYFRSHCKLPRRWRCLRRITS